MNSRKIDVSPGAATSPLWGALLGTAVLSILQGFVLKVLWNWFVPRAIHGAVHINFVEGIGLGLVLFTVTGKWRISMDIKRYLPKSQQRDMQAAADAAHLLRNFPKAVWRWIFNNLAQAGLLLLIGWIVHSFV